MSELREAYTQQILEGGDHAAAALRGAKSAIGAGELYDLLVEWVASIRINRNQSANTAGNYVRNVVRWAQYIQKNGGTVATAAYDDVDRWQKQLAVDGLAPTSRNLALVAVRRFYAFGVITGRLPGNPATTVQGAKQTDRTPRKFSDAHLSLLLRACDRTRQIGQRDFAVLVFFLNTGARLEEVVALKIDQLVLTQKTGVARFHGKGNKERVVSFEGVAVNALWEWLAVRDKLAAPGTDAVFLSLSGGSKGKALGRSGVANVLTRALKRAGLKKHPDDPFGVHRLRSCYATKMYDYTRDIHVVKNLLGHKDINTTERYIVISDTHLSTRMPGDYTAELIGQGAKMPAYVKTRIDRRPA